LDDELRVCGVNNRGLVCSLVDEYVAVVVVENRNGDLSNTKQVQCEKQSSGRGNKWPYGKVGEPCVLSKLIISYFSPDRNSAREISYHFARCQVAGLDLDGVTTHAVVAPRLHHTKVQQSAKLCRPMRG
jgi:hypothetical protein